MLVIIVVVAVLVLIAYASFKQDEGKTESFRRTLAVNNGFSPAVSLNPTWDREGIAIDTASNRFAILSNDGSTRVFSFHDLLDVEICRDGQSVTKTNRGSQAAGAAVGALLLGPVGLLAGGLTGSKRIEEKVKSISLKLYTTDIQTPVREIYIFKMFGGARADSFLVRSAIKQADEWYGRLRVIVEAARSSRAA